MLRMILFFFLFSCRIDLVAQENSRLFGEKEQEEVIVKMAGFLRDNYVAADKGTEYYQSLISDLEEGRFKSFRHPRSFVLEINKRLLEINPDKHVRVLAESPEEQELKRENPVLSILLHSLERQTGNRGFRQAGVRNGNVGYMELVSFEPAETVRSRFNASLAFLEHADAVIIDLRDNRGGDIGMVSELAGIFFREPVDFSSYYWRRGDYIEQYRTKPQQNIENLHDIPLFILVSKRTFSAAEDFAYGMQTLGRAELIGETTGGGANPGFSFRLDDRFYIFIPTGRAINPVTGTNWEAKGVVPDIAVKEGQALNVALDRAAGAGRTYRSGKDRKSVDAFWDLANHLQNTDEAPDSLLADLLAKSLIEEWTINKLGYFYMSEKQPEKALNLFLFNTRRFSDSVNAWDSLAEFYADTGDTTRSVENYQRVLHIDPDNQHAKYMLNKLIPGQLTK